MASGGALNAVRGRAGRRQKKARGGQYNLRYMHAVRTEDAIERMAEVLKGVDPSVTVTAFDLQVKKTKGKVFDQETQTWVAK